MDATSDFSFPRSVIEKALEVQLGTGTLLMTTDLTTIPDLA